MKRSISSEGFARRFHRGFAAISYSVINLALARFFCFQDYAAKVKEHSEQMKALEAKRDELQTTEVKYAEVRAWLDTFIAQTMKADALMEIDSITMKMLVEKIIARDAGIEAVFKCGVAIEKEYVR